MAQATNTTDAAEQSARVEKRAAGAFDIRTFIALLLGIYGVVLLLVGLFGDNTTRDGESSVNLWTGLGLIVFAAVFQTWAKLRPVLVPEHPEHPESTGE